MMDTGKILVQLRLFIMPIWGLQKSQCQISGNIILFNNIDVSLTFYQLIHKMADEFL